MFKKYTITLILLWLILTAACFWTLHSSSEKGQRAYQRLMSDSVHDEKIEGKELSPTRQTRFQVSKQIIFKKNNDRLQTRLSSLESELIYGQKGYDKELLEYFKGINCTVQDKLFVSKNKFASLTGSNEPSLMQSVRHLEGEKAVYSYKTGQLEAERVNMAHYLIPGHMWMSSFESFQPLIQGKAEKINLSLFDEPLVKAQGFQAIFHEQGREE